MLQWPVLPMWSLRLDDLTCANSAAPLSVSVCIRVSLLYNHRNSIKHYKCYFCGAAFLEKLIGAQPITKFPAYMEPENSLPQFTSLSQINQVCILPSYIFWSTVLLLSFLIRLGIPSYAIPFHFSEQNILWPFHIFGVCYIPRRLHPPWFSMYTFCNSVWPSTVTYYPPFNY
jgi:hypothetical protein